jgi:hypothetical protein
MTFLFKGGKPEKSAPSSENDKPINTPKEARKPKPVKGK